MRYIFNKLIFGLAIALFVGILCLSFAEEEETKDSYWYTEFEESARGLEGMITKSLHIGEEGRIDKYTPEDSTIHIIIKESGPSSTSSIGAGGSVAAIGESSGDLVGVSDAGLAGGVDASPGNPVPPGGGGGSPPPGGGDG